MIGDLLAPLAVLLELQSVGIVSLVLGGGIILSLAFVASEIDDYSDVTAGFLCHGGPPLDLWESA
jgi:hypothetical protein